MPHPQGLCRPFIEGLQPIIFRYPGTEQQIDDVCNLFRCYRSKGQAYDDPQDYILDHTVTQYIINPEGKTVGYFMSNRDLDERVPIFLDHVQKYNEHKAAILAEENAQPSILESVKQLIGLSPSPAS